MSNSWTGRPATLRCGAVLATAGPVIATASGADGWSAGWLCPLAGTHPLERVLVEALFWARVLLPLVVACLLLRRPGRAAVTSVCAIGAVLALGLVTMVGMPATDPCTGEARAFSPPWILIACYAAAAAALIAAASSPPSSARGGVLLWVPAAAVAGWTAATCRIPVPDTGFACSPPPSPPRPPSAHPGRRSPRSVTASRREAYGSPAGPARSFAGGGRDILSAARTWPY
ncbi:hypothetical protein ACWEN6_20745 [Sphaerisporangium sp. NPDC004334]